MANSGWWVDSGWCSEKQMVQPLAAANRATAPRLKPSFAVRAGTTWQRLFVFSAAMLRQVNLLLILAGMLIGPVVFSRRLVAATLDGLRVRRKLPRALRPAICWRSTWKWRIHASVWEAGP